MTTAMLSAGVSGLYPPTYTASASHTQSAYHPNPPTTTTAGDMTTMMSNVTTTASGKDKTEARLSSSSLNLSNISDLVTGPNLSGEITLAVQTLGNDTSDAIDEFGLGMAGNPQQPQLVVEGGEGGGTEGEHGITKRKRNSDSDNN